MKINYNPSGVLVRSTNLGPGDTFLDLETSQHFLVCRYTTDDNSTYLYELDLATGIFNMLSDRLVIKTNAEVNINAT